jgi:FkbM family methyltransferase
MYETRYSKEWKKEYVWPKEDVHLWRHLNKEKYGQVVPKTVADISDSKGVIVQAGGACGVYADYYSKRFGKVWTFEPDPDNFHCLKENTKNIIAFNCALGENLGMVTIYNDRKNFGATHIVKKEGPIRVLTIDSMSVYPDVIHLDVEGYETNILKGAEHVIKKCSPMLVLETVDEDYVVGKLGYTEVGRIGADTVFKRLSVT